MSQVPGAPTNPIAQAEGAVSTANLLILGEAPGHAGAPATRGPVAASALASVVLSLSFWAGFAIAGVTGMALTVLVLPSLAAAAVCRVAQRATHPVAVESPVARLTRAVGVATAGEAVLIAGAAVFGIRQSAAAIVLTWSVATWVAASSESARRMELRYRARMRRAFVIGTEREVTAFSHEAGRQGGVSVVDVARCLPDGSLERPAEELRALVKAARPTVVVVADRCLETEAVSTLLWQISVGGVRVRRLSDFYETEFHKVALASVSGSWFLFDVAEIHHRRLYGAAKRLAECLIALAVLAVTAPLLAAVAIAIRFSSPGPILFRQSRVGRHGKPFELVKFRTMHCSVEAEHGRWARSDDPRIFGFGRVLRQFRLDELPQLWNVLRGHLSLVGPRPEQPQLVDELARTIPFYETRVCVRPGLTGWAQVNYGYGGSELGTRAKLEYDLYYIKHQSLALDLKVVLSTVTTIAAGGGA
jgi:exopolysaccharide biosynthesis polyprenyl glycosylphosphotransferase